MAERKRNTGTSRASGRNQSKAGNNIRKPGNNTGNGMGNEIAGILLIGLGLLMAAGIFTDRIGRLGKILKEMDFTTFGVLGYLFPFLILYLGVAFITRKADFFFDRRFVGFLILITSMSVFFSVKYASATRGMNFSDSVRIIAESFHVDHGGIYGYIFAVPMVKFTGEVGTFIFTVLGYFLGTVLLLNMTVYQALGKLKAVISGLVLFIREKSHEKGVKKTTVEPRDSFDIKDMKSDGNKDDSSLRDAFNGVAGRGKEDNLHKKNTKDGSPKDFSSGCFQEERDLRLKSSENSGINDTHRSDIPQYGRRLTKEESDFRQELLKRYSKSGAEKEKNRGGWFKNFTLRSSGESGKKKDSLTDGDLMKSLPLEGTGSEEISPTETSGIKPRADIGEIARKLKGMEDIPDDKENEGLKLELPSFLNTKSMRTRESFQPGERRKTVGNYNFDLKKMKEGSSERGNDSEQALENDASKGSSKSVNPDYIKNIPGLRLEDLRMRNEPIESDIRESQRDGDVLKNQIPSDDPVLKIKKSGLKSGIKEGIKEGKSADSENLQNTDGSLKKDAVIPRKRETDSGPIKGRQLTIDDKEVKQKRYNYPEVELLRKNIRGKLTEAEEKEIYENAEKLQETLLSFGVEAKVLNVSRGPSVTRYELQPRAGIKVSKITNLADDIALSLAASGVRIEAPIPGKAAVGIEIPNKDTRPVFLREVIDSERFKSSTQKLAVALGEDIGGETVVGDMARFPHVLIAGATGSGKSVCINSLIVSLLYKYTPEEVRLIMVDPKVVELSVYNGIPHLLIPVVTDPKKATGALHWAVTEMTRRYQLFAENSVKNLEGYNALYEKGKIEEKIPYIVIIVDELADLMMVSANEVEDYILRLSQMARAAGMHLVIATQRPSVDVITGVIKANIPSRISFAVSSYVDSKTILDQSGAEKLLGKGDMLYYPVGAQKPKRVQGAFISEEEVESIVEYIRENEDEAEYDESVIEHIEQGSKQAESSGEEEDELLGEAINTVVMANQASTSFLQRKMKIGYSRAARIMDALEARGVIGAPEGSKPRKVNWKPEDI